MSKNTALFKIPKLPNFKELDKIIAEFYQNASGTCESDRTHLAMQLCREWKKSELPMPAKEEGGDYWYFVHLLAQDKHVYHTGVYPLSFGRFDACYVESFTDAHEAPSELLKALFGATNKTPTRYLSRRDSDSLIESGGEKALTSLGFSPREYQIRHIPLELYLIGMHLNLWGNEPIYTHVDGYRLRDDGVTAALFTGNYQSPHLPCIDSYFLHFHSKRLISRYAIIPRR